MCIFAHAKIRVVVGTKSENQLPTSHHRRVVFQLWQYEISFLTVSSVCLPLLCLHCDKETSQGLTYDGSGQARTTTTTLLKFLYQVGLLPPRDADFDISSLPRQAPLGLSFWNLCHKVILGPIRAELDYSGQEDAYNDKKSVSSPGGAKCLQHA